MTAPDAACPAESVEAVLAAWFEENLTYDHFAAWSNEDFATALAAALAEAGIGSLAQARAEGRDSNFAAFRERVLSNPEALAAYELAQRDALEQARAEGAQAVLDAVEAAMATPADTPFRAKVVMADAARAAAQQAATDKETE